MKQESVVGRCPGPPTQHVSEVVPAVCAAERLHLVACQLLARMRNLRSLSSGVTGSWMYACPSTHCGRAIAVANASYDSALASVNSPRFSAITDDLASRSAKRCMTGVCSSRGMCNPLTMMMAHPSGSIASSSSCVHCFNPISPTSEAIEIQVVPSTASAK
eukprot:scaffold39643_cov71-Phaeocystis_antarctica.AAC.11